MTRLTDEDIAERFLVERGFSDTFILKVLTKLLVEYPEYHTNKRYEHALENNPEIRQRLIDIAVKMDVPINKEA